MVRFMTGVLVVAVSASLIIVWSRSHEENKANAQQPDGYRLFEHSYATIDGHRFIIIRTNHQVSAPSLGITHHPDCTKCKDPTE